MRTIRGTVELVLITIIAVVGAAAAAAGAIAAGERDREPAMIPVPVRRPGRRRRT